jgi:hypothetical protein
MGGAALGLACLGCILLSLSLRRHYKQVWPESTDYAQWVTCNRIVGFVLVCVALVPCVVAYGLWIGLALWLSALALAALLQTFVLTYWPSRSLLFSGASLMLVFVGLLLGRWP